MSTFFRTEYISASFNLFIVIVAIGLILYVKKTGQIDKTSKLMLLNATAAITYYLFTGGLDGEGIFMIPLVPYFAFFLFGRKDGTKFIVFYGLFILSIMLGTKFNLLTSVYMFEDMIKMLPAYIMMSSLLYVYELRNHDSMDTILKQQENLEFHNRNIEQIVHDRTSELEKKNRELELAKAEAVEANNSKSLFLANMSHEIRTPLNAILGFIGLLLNKERDSEKIKYLKTIDDSSISLLNIINDILDLAKIESGKFTTENIDFMPKNELNQTIELFLPRAAQKSIQFKTDIDPSIPVVLHSDILRIKQVVHNLLSNAIKFSNIGGTVTLKARYDTKKEQFSISVSDNGIGVPKDVQGKIFDTFTQSDNSITRKHGGTGLGLSISQKIAHILGGRITIESEENIGSAFMLTLPVSLGKNIMADNVYTDMVAKHYNGHVLIVEDNKTNQFLIDILLKERSIKTDIVNDGQEAVDIVKKERFDLILMDENMPNLNGLTAMREIRKYEAENGLEKPP